MKKIVFLSCLLMIQIEALKQVGQESKPKVPEEHLKKVDQEQYPKRASTHEGLKAKIFSFAEQAHHDKFEIESSVNVIKSRIHPTYTERAREILDEFNEQYDELNAEINKLAEIHARIDVQGESAMDNFNALQHTINQKIERLREKGKELNRLLPDVPMSASDYRSPRTLEEPSSSPMYRGRPYGVSPIEYEEVEMDE